MLLADSFIQTVEKPETSVSSLVDKRRAQNIQQNKTILKCIAECILFCGKQCIALRGDHENLNKPGGNCGNFLSLLKLVANHNEVLRNHLNAPAMKSVTYMSPQTQNELIQIMGKHIIQSDICKRGQESKILLTK